LASSDFKLCAALAVVRVGNDFPEIAAAGVLNVFCSFFTAEVTSTFMRSASREVARSVVDL
jgi:hypothetical protein